MFTLSALTRSAIEVSKIPRKEKTKALMDPQQHHSSARASWGKDLTFARLPTPFFLSSICTNLETPKALVVGSHTPSMLWQTAD